MRILVSIISLATGALAFAPTKLGKISPALKMADATGEAEAAPVEAAPVEEAPVETAPAPVEVVKYEGDGEAALSNLKSMAPKLNPLVSYYDPLGLADGDFYLFDQSKEATIGFLRHAEIKHGRVAMAAFVGYCVQSNWHWPWAMTTAGDPFPSIDMSPEAQWDAIPAVAKWQIILVIGFFEGWSEGSGQVTDEPHYMRGGQPGKFPSFKDFRENIHPILDLYDPFNLNAGMDQETKDRRLLAEINNGRLAMLGIFGFLAADTIEGSVPLLNSIAQPYAGQVMSPFETGYN